LYRNGTQVVQGSGNQFEIITLAAAVWNYTCIYSQSQNYTSSSTVDNYLTISKASSTINLLLNDTDGDKLYNISDVINSTIELTTPSGTNTVYLDTNITDWTTDSGSSPRQNMTSISTVGKYNFTGYWNGNQNYTGASETHYVTIYQPGYLEVTLVYPAATQSMVQNRTFTLNATVYCRNTTNCGNVQGTVQYNGSSTNPNTPVNVTTEDKPFFINETSAVAVKNCPTNPLSQNEYCNITWTVNASGNINSAYKLGVLFNSTISGVSNNHTTNSTTTIVGCVADLTLQWSSINFDSLNPSSTQNAAPDNANKQYNITVNYGSCTPDLWIRGEDLTNTTLGYTIGVGNLTWSNSTNNYANSYNMTTYYRLVDEDVPEETNVTTYYWLNVPAVAAGGPYKGNITIMTNRTPGPE